MYRYLAYGLSIASEIELPELRAVPATSGAGIVVRHGIVGERPSEDSAANAFYLIEPGLACARWSEGGLFRMSEGRELVMEMLPGADGDLLRTLLLGPFMAMLLHQRGSLVLHGSGVEVDGGVVAFIGETGRGKSTTATAFMRAGHRLVADDLLAISVGSGSGGEPPLVAPGPPFLKLWPEAARALGHSPEELPQITPTREKRLMRIEMEKGLAADALPLLAIYVLGGESQIPTESIGPQEALLELTRHSYCAPAITGPAGMKEHFLQCTAIINRVPIRRLNRSFPIERLGEMVELVRREVGGS
jgi:hypothetical protein